MKLAFVLSLLLVAWTNAQPHARLIGGTDKDAATYEISYQWELFGVKTHFCGGAILSDKWAVTAGHCVKGVDNLGEFYVVVGDKNVDDASKLETKVINKVVHPNYEGNLGPYDIALLELESLTLNPPIETIALPVQGAELTDAPLTISGWGGTDNSTSTTNSKLQKIDNVKILTYEDCKKTVKELVGLDNLLNKDVNICSTPEDNTKSQGPCSGDSGDPLVQDGILVGIVSWSFSPCTTPNLPTVYTKISEVWDFIHNITKI